MVGRTVSHYRILDRLGRGGMSVVYRAEDLRPGRQVALKFFPADLNRDQQALDRFQREARAASALSHPHICFVYSIDEADGERDPAGKRRMMAVAFTLGSPPTLGRPRELFSFDPRTLWMSCKQVRCYDVAPDGRRFYAVQASLPPAPVVTHINLILNWFEEPKAKVTPGR